jgi:hypothetical protein
LWALLEEGRATRQHLIEIHSPWRAGDSDAPALTLPAQGAVLRRRISGFVATGQHDQVAHIFRQIETAQP